MKDFLGYPEDHMRQDEELIAEWDRKSSMRTDQHWVPINANTLESKGRKRTYQIVRRGSVFFVDEEEFQTLKQAAQYVDRIDKE